MTDLKCSYRITQASSTVRTRCPNGRVCGRFLAPTRPHETTEILEVFFKLVGLVGFKKEGGLPHIHSGIKRGAVVGSASLFFNPNNPTNLKKTTRNQGEKRGRSVGQFGRVVRVS